MKLDSLFRLILLGSLFFAALGFVAGVSLSGTLPPLLKQYVSENASSPLTDGDAVMLVVAIALLLLMLVATIGLWKFRRWGRNIWAGLNVLTILFDPFFGPTVATGWEAMFYDTSLILSGVVLTMMYFGETGEYFRHGRKLAAA